MDWVSLVATITPRKWTTGKGKIRRAFQVNWVDNQRIRHRKQFSTKREADRFRIEVEGRVQNGTFRGDADRIKVAEALCAFLANCAERHRNDERMSAHNLNVYRGHVENHMLHPTYGLGSYHLGKLSAKSIDRWLKDLRDTCKVSVQTRRKILSTLRVAIDFCIGEDWLAVNPAKAVRIITPRGQEPKKIIPPTQSEIKNLLHEIERDPDFHTDVLFSALSGARAGEKRAITWSDIDFETSQISITKSVDRQRNVTRPKTRAGVREIPMSDHLAAKLKEHRLRSSFSQDEDLVFPDRDGKHADHDNLVKRKFKPALLSAGLSGINWHALRHFAISVWISQGLSPKEVQTFAGHASIAFTMDQYGHLFPKNDHKMKFDGAAKSILQ